MRFVIQIKFGFTCKSRLYLQDLLGTDPKLDTFMKDPSVSIADKRSKNFLVSVKYYFSLHLMISI